MAKSTRTRASASSERELAGLIARWCELDESDQLAWARTVAARRTREFQRRFANVLSVGVGWRTIGRRRRVEREVCLRFLVAKKWPRGSKARAGKIPKGIKTIARTGRGARVRCAIPTDVDVLGKGSASGSVNLTEGVRAIDANGGGSISGSVCCMVRENGKERRLLLGCHHVFARSLNAASCTPQADSVLVDFANQRVGALVDWATLGTGSGFGIDAALVDLDDTSMDRLVLWGTSPVRVAQPLEFPTSYQIFARRRAGTASPLSAQFISEQFGLSLQYQCGRIVRVRSIYESIAATRSGDSGAPLIGTDGTLYGMHFYETDAGRSLALPAPELFRSGVFSIDIELA